MRRDHPYQALHQQMEYHPTCSEWTCKLFFTQEVPKLLVDVLAEDGLVITKTEKTTGAYHTVLDGRVESFPCIRICVAHQSDSRFLFDH